MISLMLGTVGLAYGSVPLYKMVRVQSTKRVASILHKAKSSLGSHRTVWWLCQLPSSNTMRKIDDIIPQWQTTTNDTRLFFSWIRPARVLDSACWTPLGWRKERSGSSQELFAPHTRNGPSTRPPRTRRFWSISRNIDQVRAAVDAQEEALVEQEW